MSIPLVLRRLARAEYDNAADWYDQRRVGLGAAFTAAVQDVLDQISDQPSLFPVALDDIREALVTGFPYCVYYRASPTQAVILAVFHTSRDPSIWQGRT